MLKRLIISITLLSIVTFSVPSTADEREKPYDPMFAMADVVLLRPVGLVFTIVGTGLFLGFSPLTALASIAPPHDAFEIMGYALVMTPVQFTFIRPVGVKEVEEISVPPGMTGEKGATGQ